MDSNKWRGQNLSLILLCDCRLINLSIFHHHWRANTHMHACVPFHCPRNMCMFCHTLWSGSPYVETFPEYWIGIWGIVDSLRCATDVWSMYASCVMSPTGIMTWDFWINASYILTDVQRAEGVGWSRISMSSFHSPPQLWLHAVFKVIFIHFL